ncbi:TIGR04141 family sporadically distributed protein, partial [Enterobacter hormaechei]
MKARFSIYLAKDIKTGTDQVLNLERVKPPIRLDITDTDSYLYIKEETEPQIPEWASIFFAIKPDIPNNAFGKNSSTGAVLSVKYKGYHFLMPFGTGHHLINDMYIIQGFGLKVTLNSIGKDRIRSVDKSNHNETSLLTRNQSSKEVSIYNLKIDSELDFLTTLTGVCTEELLGDKVTGRDALVLTPDFELNKFSSILHTIIDLYNKPLPNEFEWVNNIKQADQE